MGIGRTESVALLGLTGSLVEVEAHAAAGLPQLAIIGLPDAALSESRDRVRSAAGNSGSTLSQKHVTVNLSPAALPKTGSGFDLAIAVACLAATGEVDAASVASTVHLGELGLDGRVRPSAGVLPAVLALARAGRRRVMVPLENETEANLVDGVTVIGVESLSAAAHRHGTELREVELAPALSPPAPPEVAPHRPEPDLAEVVGNDEAIDAMIVAAAGGHHVFLLGPPGSGKTMLADRLPGLLPDLEGDAALEASCLASLTGRPLGGRLVSRPPIESPHHTASAAAMVGGGSTRIRPGAAARASRGVLFLDEAPEFAASVLDSLRQPLESGVIRIDRAAASAQFPARFQLVMAANPCPCGNHGVSEETCTCTPTVRRRYLARLSGPLLDRLDIRLTVRRIGAAQLRAANSSTRTTTAEARRRVVAARSRSAHRLAETPWRLNAEVPGSALRSSALRPDAPEMRDLDRALERGTLSMRGYDRVLRVAWTLADLDEAERPDRRHLARAVLLRSGGPA